KGAFSYEAYRRKEYGNCPVGHSIAEVKQAIDRQGGTGAASSSRIILASLPDDRMASLLPEDDTAKDWLLVGRDQHVKSGSQRRLVLDQPTVMEWSAKVATGNVTDVGEPLSEKRFDIVTIPWAYPETWKNNFLEASAQRIAGTVEVVTEAGAKRTYHG